MSTYIKVEKEASGGGGEKVQLCLAVQGKLCSLVLTTIIEKVPT